MSAFSAALTSVGIDLSDVKLVQSNAVVRPLQAVTVQGGLQLSVSSSLGGGRCTTGFAATRGSERGFLAAGHCAILAQDGAADPNVKISLAGNLFNHGASKWNSTTDLAFFWNSSNNLVAGVNWGGGVHPIRSTASNLLTPGTLVCKMGSVSGYACKQVNSNNTTTTDTRTGKTVGPTSTLYCHDCTGTTNPLGLKGDSGGPVYINGTAYGIIRSADYDQYNNPLGKWLWFTPSTRFVELSNVNLLLAP